MRNSIVVLALPLATMALSGCSSDKANTPAAASPNSLSEASPSEAKTLFVHEERVDCEGVAPRRCLQVRESESEEWTYFYSTIEGFDYEEGTRYELLVSIEEVPNPPADASSLRYTLVEIVSAERVSAE